MEPSEKPQKNSENSLTSIHDAYTLASTNEQNAGEVEKIMIQNFLQTLSPM